MLRAGVQTALRGALPGLRLTIQARGSKHRTLTRRPLVLAARLFLRRRRRGSHRGDTSRYGVARLRSRACAPYSRPLSRKACSASTDRRRPRRQAATLDEDDRPEKALADEQFAVLLAQVPDAHQPFVKFVAQTGMRISEAVAVR